MLVVLALERIQGSNCVLATGRSATVGREPIFNTALQEATNIRFAPKEKAAFALAQRFENDILGRSVAQESHFGSEEILAERYGISRKTVRQALRILEARALGRMRRGQGGGLQLHQPSQHEVSRFMAIHLQSIGVDLGEVIAARNWLVPLLENRQEKAAGWAMGMFGALEAEFGGTGGSCGAEGENRALLVARRIMRDCRQASERGGDGWIGRIEDLEERHASDRRVVLQALRVLEDLELLAVRRGRNGGLMATQPSAGAIVRFTYPYFVLTGMSRELSGDLVWSINKLNAAMAAERVMLPLSQSLQQILNEMTLSQFERGDFSKQVLMWRVLADASSNRVLHMLVRCLFYYQIHSGVASLEQNHSVVAERSFAYTARVCRAVLAQNPVAAADAVSLLESVSRSA